MARDGDRGAAAIAGFATRHSLLADLDRLGVAPGDGVFVHASMRAIGPVVGGARTVVQALIDRLGPDGLLAMPGFSADATLPPAAETTVLPEPERAALMAAVPGFDPVLSPTDGMGVVAETFRTWPGTRRSNHPCVSVCARGADAEAIVADHALAWACGPETPFAAMATRPRMKIALVGVGWNRCTALHAAETAVPARRTGTRLVKLRDGSGARWVEVRDVADDLGRLFPTVGAELEAAGRVAAGRLGRAEVRLVDWAALIRHAVPALARLLSSAPPPDPAGR